MKQVLETMHILKELIGAVFSTLRLRLVVLCKEVMGDVDCGHVGAHFAENENESSKLVLRTR